MCIRDSAARAEAEGSFASTLFRKPGHAAYWLPVTDIAADRARLLENVQAKAIVHGRATRSSGREEDYLSLIHI